MTKRKCKIKFLIIAIVFVIFAILTFVGFTLPSSSTNFKGFFNALPLGVDFGGGTMAVYQVDSEDLTSVELQQEIDITISKLVKVLDPYGYTVIKQGEDKIKVSSSTFDTDNTIYLLLGSDKGFNINSSSSDASAEGVSGKYIDSCVAEYNKNAGSWGITLNFNEEGKELFYNLTKEQSGGGTIYFYLDGQLVNQNGLSVSDPVSNGSTFIGINNQTSAVNLALEISLCAKPLYLKEIVNDKITAGISSNASLMLMLSIVVCLVATMIFFAVRYGILGGLADFALLFFGLIYIFFLQAVPIVRLNTAGIVGVVATLFILIDGMIIIMERIRKEFANGKKIPNSVSSGFKKNLIPVLEVYAFLLIACALIYILATSTISMFAVTLFIGLLLNYFTLFCLFWGFCKLYLPINSTNRKLYKLTREAHINEF